MDLEFSIIETTWCSSIESNIEDCEVRARIKERQADEHYIEDA
jgi:hypothetical protein